MTLLTDDDAPAPTGFGSVLALRDVVKSYPGLPPVRALDGVDLDVDRGELVGIVGPSGSGKSTLLNVVGTLDRPTSGSVRIEGREVADLTDRELSAVRAHLIGFVFQQFFLLPGTDATDNVAQGLLYLGVPPEERRARARASLEQVGLGHRADHRPNELSGGERQRVAIARALVSEPSLVLADEPTGNLDTVTSESIMSLLHELHAAGTTILVITHDHEVAAQLPRQVRFRDGAIVADDSR